MIVPFFTIDQDDEYVTVDLKISHLRFNASSLELVLSDNLMVFALPPYYLRLRFPHSFDENDDERITAQYISADDVLRLKLPKLEKGQFFPDLDFTAKLLARDGEQVQEPVIQEAGASGATKEKPAVRPLIQEMDMSEENRDQDLREAEALNWEVKQQVPEDPITLPGVDSKFQYGFDNTHKEMLNISLSNGNDINELGNPDATTPDDRIMERLIKENIKFDIDYYASDYLLLKHGDEDEARRIRDLIEWKFPRRKQFLKHMKAKQDGETTEDVVPLEFTKEEQEKIQNLQVKTYLVDDPKPQYQMILSVLFAYCFDLRSGEGDTTVESGWNIGKLVPQIACLDSQLIQSNNSLEKNLLRVLVITLTRRALCYPLVRHWDLCMKVWDDVYFTLRCGKRAVIKSLLAAREPFRFHEVYYVYNLVWFEELLGWCLSSDAFNEATLRDLAHEVHKETDSLKKEDITFEKCLDEESEDIEAINLVEIEAWADRNYSVE